MKFDFLSLLAGLFGLLIAAIISAKKNNLKGPGEAIRKDMNLYLLGAALTVAYSFFSSHPIVRALVVMGLALGIMRVYELSKKVAQMPTYSRTMAQADAAAHKKFGIGFTVVILIIAGLFYIPNDLYFHQYYMRAGQGWKVVSYILFTTSIGSLWGLMNASLGERSGWVYGAVCLGLLLLAMLCAGGWDFSLFGLKEV